MHYNIFKYYNLDIGRFTQPDRIELLGGLNLYPYVPNPLSWIDLLGLVLTSVDFTRSTDLFTGKGNQ